MKKPSAAIRNIGGIFEGRDVSRAVNVSEGLRLEPLRDGLKPAREHATNNAQTNSVRSKTGEGCALFRAESIQNVTTR